MSTYLLAFVIGELHKVESKNHHGVQIFTYAPLNQPAAKLHFANRVASDALDFYAEKFGIDYPLSKLDQVALPDFEAGAMENWGLVTYRESLLLSDANSSLETKKSIALVIAHELSHQWFGNLVTMQWWDDLWLNESFATMIEYICIDYLFPEWQVMDDFFMNERLVAMNRDSSKGVQNVHQSIDSPDEIQTLFDGAIVYAKGACLMYMLKEKLSDINFYAGLKDYFAKHAYGSTIGADLWHSLQKYADFNVANFMEQWLSQPNFPIISKVTSKNNPKNISQNQTQKSIVKNTSNSWNIENVKTDLSGYYLINLNEKSFAGFARLPKQEKMRILLDANILSRTNNLPIHLIFNIFASLSLNDDDTIWLLAISNLRILHWFFDDNHLGFSDFLQDLLLPKLHQIGIIKNPNESSKTTELRTALLAWLLHASSKEVIDFLLSHHHANLSSIDSHVRSFVLVAKVQNDFSDTLFSDFLAEYKSTENPELKDDLEAAISSIKTAEYVQTTLALLQDFAIVRPQDTLGFFANLVRNEKAKDPAWSFLQNNWLWFEQNFGGGKSLDYYPRLIANVFKTQPDLENYTNFFTAFKSNPELKRSILVGEEEIKTRVELITTHTPAVLQTLTTYVPQTTLNLTGKIKCDNI